MLQSQAVILTMERLGGLATLGQLNKEVFMIKDCKWNTKTPFASIRRIVQVNKEIYKIRPGLYALLKYKRKLESNGIYSENKRNKNSPENISFNHSYYQGLIVEIGNMKGYVTYVPPQDKNKSFLNKKLGLIASLDRIHNFTYENLVDRAKTIDVIWFNNRNLLNSLFEVEHSTDIQNSLLKYNDLQDFNANLYVVSSLMRKNEFAKKIKYSSFNEIQKRVQFLEYDFISELHSKLSALHAIGTDRLL